MKQTNMVSVVYFCSCNIATVSFHRGYSKRMNNSLPFYYWTSNERFRDWEEELPSFNLAPEVPDDVDPKEHPLRLHRLRVNRREDASLFLVDAFFQQETRQP